MALKRKGEDPKTKVKITSVKEDVTPNAENKRKMDEYNAASTAYKSAESKYKSDVETYNKQMKVYSDQPKSSRRDVQTKFAGGGRYLNAQELEKWNASKSGDRAGLTSSKVYVSKDYDPNKEYKGYFHEDLNKPTAPKKQTLAEPKAPNLSLERMPMLKIKKIETTSSKKLAERTPSEETNQWQAPSRRYTETKVTKSTARNAARDKGKLGSAKVSDISLKSRSETKKAIY